MLRTCFQGVQRDGELIQVRDTVLLKSGPRKKSLPYVAKISALWEEPESGRTLPRLHWDGPGLRPAGLKTLRFLFFSSGELMMSLFWYYRPEHTQGGRSPSVCEVSAPLFLSCCSASESGSCHSPSGHRSKVNICL